MPRIVCNAKIPLRMARGFVVAVCNGGYSNRRYTRQEFCLNQANKKRSAGDVPFREGNDMEGGE